LQDYDFAQTKIGEIDLVSFDSDGFTMDQVDADATAQEVLYLAFGPPEAAGSLLLMNRSIANFGGMRWLSQQVK